MKPNKTNTVNISVLILCLICLAVLSTSCKKKDIDTLLAHGKLSAAANACEDLDGQAQKDAYQKVATHYFRESLFERAAFLYAKAGNHGSAVNSYWLAKLYTKAENYCNKQTGDAKKECAEILGKSFYLKGNYNKSLQYYEMAEKPETIKRIKIKIPVFILVEKLQKTINTTKDKNLKGKLTDIQDTLKGLIYDVDEYREWRRGRETETDRQAADICEKCLVLMDTKLAPTFIEKINQITEPSQWTLETIETLSFHQKQLKNVIKIPELFHNIARQRNLLKEYIAVGQSSNYEAVYEKAVKSANGLLETLVASEKKTDGRSESDYINDLEVDMEVIEYIAAMLDNIKVRFRNVGGHAKKIRLENGDDSTTLKTESITKNFSTACEGVLTEVVKGDYNKANERLLSSYEAAKKELAQLEKPPVQMP